jgi:hypothetical protein
MNKLRPKAPRFNYTQRVSFIGGEGIIRSLEFESGTWMYLVEMPLGILPDFGRIGAEAMVLMTEAELRAS